MQKDHFVMDSIGDLTSDSLTKLLRSHWKTPSQFSRVQTLTVERVEQGVLSQVFRVSAIYDFGDDHSHSLELPAQWIVKLPRKDLNLEWMFLSEKVFYEIFFPLIEEFSLPFTVPRLLLAGEKYIILEGLENASCYELISGTPPEKIDYLTFALASLHAKSWNSSVLNDSLIGQGLNRPPGMGQRLHPLSKEHLFTVQWREAVDAIQELDPLVKKFIVQLCEQMEIRRLRDVHQIVHADRCACIHGDFHIANFLFPNDESKKPSLVDWATFGFGNPMTDLAFFLVLNESVASNVEDWLQKYYKHLTGCNPALSDSFPFEGMLERFRWAILCQWMILVAYDKMSRQLATGGDDPKQTETKLKHFANVNRRAVVAMHALGAFEPLLARLPLVTEEERTEARDFNKVTPLSI